MWLVLGTAERTTRIAGGARVDRHCERCGETTTFYEKEIKSTFRLYFIDVYDYRTQRVMACGGCGTCYATDELGAPALHEEAPALRSLRSLGDGVERGAQSAGDFIERAAEAVESRVSSLLSGSARSTPRPSPATTTGAEPDELVDDVEERFRELERRARVRIE